MDNINILEKSKMLLINPFIYIPEDVIRVLNSQPYNYCTSAFSTYSLTEDKIKEETKEQSLIKEDIFTKKDIPIPIKKIIIPQKTSRKKRGRVLSSTKNEEYLKFAGKKKLFQIKMHSRDDIDNIMRKIKVYFHNFLLVFINKCIEKKCDKKYKIKKISSKITQNISIRFNKKLFNKTLKEFFSSEISSKYSNSNENDNAKKLNQLTKHESLKKILSMTYIDAYNKLFVSEDVSLIDEEYIDCYNESPNLNRIINELISKEQKICEDKGLIDNKEECDFKSYWEKVRDYAKNSFIKKIITTRQRKSNFKINCKMLFSDGEEGQKEGKEEDEEDEDINGDGNTKAKKINNLDEKEKNC